jgi:hypothetical protein
LILLLTSAGGARERTAEASSPIVYGTDDRSEWFESSNELARAFVERSLLAVVPSEELQPSGDGRLTLSGPTLGDKLDLCADERFALQPSAATCTAVLAAPDIAITAGHCFLDAEDCRGHSLVFGFYYAAEGELAAIDEDAVYRCESLVDHRRGSSVHDEHDYAIVRLDRHAAQRYAVADFDADAELVQVGAELTAVGFMGGLPAKIDARAEVKVTSMSAYFEAAIDTAAGSSGMPLLDAKGRVVGHHVRGLPDFQPDGSCLRGAMGTNEGSQFEHVEYAAPALRALCLDPLRQEFCTSAEGDGSAACTFGGRRRSARSPLVFVVALVLIFARRRLSVSTPCR